MSSMFTSPTSLINGPELHGTTAHVIEAFAEYMRAIELGRGDTLFSEGDPPGHLYFLTAGSVVVSRSDAGGTHVELERLSAGTFIGERELFTRERRRTTVSALERCELRVMTKQRFFELRRTDARLMHRLLRLIERRLRQQRIAIAVRNVYPNLEAQVVRDLLDAVQLTSLRTGEVLFQQSSVGRALYLIVSGRISVRGDDDPPSILPREMGPGDVLGGFELFSTRQSTETAIAQRDAELLRLDRRAFEDLVAAHPAFALTVAEQVVDQARGYGDSPTADPETRSMTVAVVPSCEFERCTGFANWLATALEGFGPTLLLTSDEFDRRFGEPVAHVASDHPLHTLATSVLDELEAEYRFVLLVPDATVTEWTRRALGRADRLLIVAPADQDPEPGRLERIADHLVPSTRRELVLLQPAAVSAPLGTRRWLERRKLAGHYHVRDDEPDHVARVARRLAGRAIGLVLSGGGARGYAHLGVWRALEELSVPVDYVGGTSMGALLAAAFAMGLQYREAVAQSEQLANPKAVFDYTIPFTALMASRKLNRLCRRVCGQRNIEDLWIPYFAVVTNLSTAEQTVRRTGPLWKAVRSSIAIPGVFAPVIEDDEVLVDGGVMNNFPVDLLRTYCESDHVIAVNVVPPRVKKKKYDLKDEASGWRILLNRLNPFARRVKAPALIGTVLRALEVNSVRLSRRNQSEAQLLLEPDVRSIGLLDFARFQQAADIGYTASKAAIRRWLTEDRNLGTRHVAAGLHVDGLHERETMPVRIDSLLATKSPVVVAHDPHQR